jgi:hypothetical protein
VARQPTTSSPFNHEADGLGREGAHEGLLEYAEAKYIATSS